MEFIKINLIAIWYKRVSVKSFWPVNTQEDFDRYLNEQLGRLETDYIDFYLVHSIRSQSWPGLKEIPINDCLDRAIKDGRIKYAGFSFHDKLHLFKEYITFKL